MKYFILVFIFNSTCLIFNCSAQYTKLLNFSGIESGSYPKGSLISDGIYLYGMTSSGGTNSNGTIFKIKSDGTDFLKIFDFTGTLNGCEPHGSLYYDGTFLYGMTYRGGSNNMGVVFKIKPDGTGYEKLFDFEGIVNGNSPIGNLIFDGTYLYGMTIYGGTENLGAIFKIKPDGSGFFKLLDFKGIENGSYPKGSLFFDGNFLYGTTSQGGSNSKGTIFKIKTDGAEYFKLFDFLGSNGDYPQGSLIFDGNFLYGITLQGGTNNFGTIFKIKPDGTGYIRLHEFINSPTGYYPQGSLISDGTYLYGATLQGGTGYLGIIFKIKPDGTGYSKLLDFTGTSNGSFSYGAFNSVGNFLFGMTSQGGTNDLGTIFKFSMSNGMASYNLEKVFNIHPNPFDEAFAINYNIPKEGKKCIFILYDLYGRLVYQEGLSAAINQLQVAANKLESGVYMASLVIDGIIVKTEKILKIEN